MTPLDSQAALELLHTAQPHTRQHQWAPGQALADAGWLFTFAHGSDFPFGAPSWIVTNDGRIGSVETHESFDEAWRRLHAQPTSAQ